MEGQNRYRGRRDVPLDAQGYQDAVDAAMLLSDKGLTAVYTGPLRRTVATAQIIADEAGVPDLRIVYDLINVDYGAWEGMTPDEAERFDPVGFRRYRADPARAVCPAGERIADAQRRILETLELLRERHHGEAVAAVTHAVLIRLAAVNFAGIDSEAWRVPLGHGPVAKVVLAEKVSITDPARSPGPWVRPGRA
jgi:broad specificity phosphatase PhoE